jgi:hypothetical protein
MPLDKTEGLAWQKLEQSLVNSLQNNQQDARDLIVRLGTATGKAWVGLLDEHHEAFSWLFQSLVGAGLAENIVSDLCFSRSRHAVRLGCRLFNLCGVSGLNQQELAKADATQVELLLLEASLRVDEHVHMARLHASVASRVDEIGGDLAELFYDEVTTQALNTHGYREALIVHANGHTRLIECVQTAKQRIESTFQAIKSPALRMHVPGWNRAQAIAMRRFSRDVSKSAEKYSIFSQLLPKVYLLYGKRWRFVDANENLSNPSELQKTEVNTEIPRLEYISPEAMRVRRTFALTRIKSLWHPNEEGSK